MRVAAFLLAVAAFAADRGLPARSSPSHYPVQDEMKGLIVAAEYSDPDQIRGSFSTDLSEYAVFEVAVYPRKDGPPLDLQTIDFALRTEGRMVRPVEPRTIARINQSKGQDRTRDIVLYPSVGVTTGTWGTGTNVGVGVGVGGSRPGPASSPADRRVMEQELEDKGLPDAVISKPVAGYLYFPVGKKRADEYVLEYQGREGDVRLTLRTK